LRVDGLTNLHGRVLKLVESLSNLIRVLGGHCLIESGDVTLNLILDILRDLGRVFLKLLLSIIDGLIGLVLQVDGFTSLLILLLGGFSILNHLINLRIG